MSDVKADSAAGQPGIPQLDITAFPNQIFWLVIFFGILFVFISRVALPRIESIQNARKDRIREDLDEAEWATAESETLREKTQQTLADARSKAEESGAEARMRIRELQEAETVRVAGEIAVMGNESEHKIAAIRAAAPAQIQEIVSSSVPDIVELILSPGTAKRADRAGSARG